MSAKIAMTVVLAAATTLCVFSAHAEDPKPEGTAVVIELTSKLFAFDYSGGFDPDRIQFLERYRYQNGFSGDRQSDSYADADLNLSISTPERELFKAERLGFGSYNHRGTVKGNMDRWGFGAYYSHFRSATGGYGYLFSPNQVPGGTDASYFFPAGTNSNSGYVAQFNDDALQSLFRIDRTTYGLGVSLKPALFGTGAGSALSAALNYDAYVRDGSRFTTYVLGGSDVTGAAARVLQRWRGFDMPVKEEMNRLTLSLTGGLGGLQIAYEGVLEKFDNKTRDFTVADFSSASPFLVSSNKPIHFMPDSTLFANNLRLAGTFGSTAIGAGYGLSVLDQDSFTERQEALGYEAGKITTNSAYLNLNTSALQGVLAEAFVRYYSRDNDSTFPVAGLIAATQDQALGVYVHNIRSLSYGVAATLRIAALRSTITAGWKHEDKERDLTWPAVSTVAPLLNGIQPQRSVYGDDSSADDVYVNLVARPMPKVVFRLTTSYVTADETTLTTEPENGLHVTSKVSYVADSGMLASGYYRYKKLENDNSTFSDALLPPGTDGPATAQDLNRVQQAAGLTLSMPVGQWANATASLAWIQDDFTAYFLQSNRRRFEAPNNAIAFLIRERPNYCIDSYVLTVGGDWQVSDALRISGSYTYSESAGSTASGMTQTALPVVDRRIESSIHSLAVGAEYAVTEKMKFKASYSYDHYSDDTFPELNGGLNVVLLAATVSF